MCIYTSPTIKLVTQRVKLTEAYTLGDDEEGLPAQ